MTVKKTQTIHVGVIRHKTGSNHYAAKSKAGLEKQVADFCREWWKDAYPDEHHGHQGLKDRAVINAYFNAMEGVESFDTGSAELEA